MTELDVAKINQHIDAGNISRRFHPEYDYLAILNYTPQCQYEGNWDDVTMMCRGLIYDHENGLLVSRPFPKFFNVQEHEQKPELGALPEWPPNNVIEKMDGSLGITYPSPTGVKIATRGSFTSDQAVWANRFLEGRLDDTISHNSTLLFEILYPENRIVVDYGDYSGLVFLDAVNNSDGSRVFLGEAPQLLQSVGQFDRATLWAHDCNISELVEERPNTEGVVLVWDQPEGPPIRAKMKSSEYVALHRFVFGLSSHKVWELLSDPDLSEEKMNDFMAAVPEEFVPWITGKITELGEKFDAIHCKAMQDWAAIKKEIGWGTVDRKKFAELNLANSDNPGLVFSIEDNKELGKPIWKLIEPDKTDKPERN